MNIKQIISIALFITASGYSSAYASNANIFSTEQSSTVNASLLAQAKQGKLSHQDIKFINEVEAYASKKGTTLLDITPQELVETGRNICTGVKQAGVSNGFKKFMGSIASETSDNGEQLAAAYLFGASIKHYCPQFAADVQNL